jgi:hypothetical protein
VSSANGSENERRGPMKAAEPLVRYSITLAFDSLKPWSFLKEWGHPITSNNLYQRIREVHERDRTEMIYAARICLAIDFRPVRSNLHRHSTRVTCK